MIIAKAFECVAFFPVPARTGEAGAGKRSVIKSLVAVVNHLTAYSGQEEMSRHRCHSRVGCR